MSIACSKLFDYSMIPSLNVYFKLGYLLWNKLFILSSLKMFSLLFCLFFIIFIHKVFSLQCFFCPHIMILCNIVLINSKILCFPSITRLLMLSLYKNLVQEPWLIINIMKYLKDDYLLLTKQESKCLTTCYDLQLLP